MKNKLNLIRTEANAPQLRKKKGKSRCKYNLNLRHGILDLPDIAVLTGEQHQGHQGPAHQQQEGRQKLNIKVGSSLIKGSGARERYQGSAHQQQEGGEFIN